MGGAVSSVIDTVGDIGQGAINTVKDVGQSVVSNGVQGLADLGQNAASFTGQIAAPVVQSSDGGGLFDGIGNLLSSAVDTVGNAGQSIIDTAKDNPALTAALITAATGGLGAAALPEASALDAAGADMVTGSMAGVAPSVAAAAAPTLADITSSAAAPSGSLASAAPDPTVDYGNWFGSSTPTADVVASPVTQGAAQETALPELSGVFGPETGEAASPYYSNAINAGTGFVDPAVAANASSAVGGGLSAPVLTDVGSLGAVAPVVADTAAPATLADLSAAAPAAAAASPYALSSAGTGAGLGLTGTLAAANTADPYALTAATTGSADVLGGGLTSSGLTGVDAMGGAAGLTAAGAGGTGVMNALGSSTGASTAVNAGIGSGIGTTLADLGTGAATGATGSTLANAVGSAAAGAANSGGASSTASQFPWMQGLLGLYDMYNKQNAAKTLQDQFDKVNSQISGMYAPGSPEANLMQQEMERKDAAAGRNSQYGVRATDLAAKLAATKGQLLSNTLGNQNNLLAASLATGNSSIGSLANLFGQTTGSSATGTAGNAVGNAVNSAIGSGVNSAIDWGKTTLKDLFGSLGG
jgi:hypothetical protein